MTPILSGEDYLALPRNPQAWLIEPVLPVGGSLLIYAEPKAGKTYLALQLALAIRNGTDWIGFPARQTGPVVYVQLDTPSNLWAASEDHYIGLMKAHGFPVETLHYADRETLDCWPFDIAQPAHAARLKTALDAIKPVAVVIDTLREAHQGSENESDEMQAAIAMLVATVQPAALVLVHHSKKPNADQGPDTRNDMRGGYIAGRMDTMFKITKGGTLSYVGRALEESSMKLIRQPHGGWSPADAGLSDAVARLLDQYPDASQREIARRLAESTGKTEAACQMLIRRLAKRPGPAAVPIKT